MKTTRITKISLNDMQEDRLNEVLNDFGMVAIFKTTIDNSNKNVYEVVREKDGKEITFINLTRNEVGLIYIHSQVRELIKKIILTL